MRPVVLRSAGIGGPALYVAAVVIGGLLWPEHRHLSQPVSDLIADGAPPKAVLDPLFAVYNLLTLAFGLALWKEAVEDRRGVHARWGRWGAIALTAEGLAGALTLLFPEGTGGAASRISATGAMHIALASVSSLTSIVAVVALGRWIAQHARRPWFWWYSGVTALFIVITGAAAAAAIAHRWPLGGLAERLTIAGFLQWMAVAAVVVTSRRVIAEQLPRAGRACG